MKVYAQKQRQPQQQSPPTILRLGATPLTTSHVVHPLTHLQRTIGNQAVQQLLQGKPDDLEARSSTKEATPFEHDFSRIPVQAKSQAVIQARLTVSSPGDTHEQEADRSSELVMRMPEPQLQRACPRGGGCPKCLTEQMGQEHERLQTKRVGSSDLGETAVPAIVHEVLRSPGQPLDPATRAFMDPRFGYDFSGVRVHADPRADAASAAVYARAFTVGADVVFRRGEFAPHTEAGRALLAHELAHVVQQQGAAERPLARIAAGKSGSAAVPQAEDAARAGVALPSRGQARLNRGMSGLALQRQEQVPTSCEDDREPNSSSVAAIINNAYGGSRSNTYQVDELNYAWFHIRNQREQPGGANCCSPELAAAEHYAYARFAVANRDHSPFEMKALIWGYAHLKFLVWRTGICPKSPDTQASRDWGYRGVDDGVNDLFHQELAQNDRDQTEEDQAEAAG